MEQNKVATWVPDFGMDPERIDIELKPLINGDFGPSGWKDLYNAGKQGKLPSLNFSIDLSQVTVQGIYCAGDSCGHRNSSIWDFV